ncbi:hypothetical protein [Pseudonocardia sp. GCM10023141]|uniref:hypothetical protein n=1 Tax=Pseudonocardia sp. GCM10023141 TaxID=3252653 RepID=UPI00360FE265
MFDPERADFAAVRNRLRDVLGAAGFAQARSSTLNAHYTDAAIALAMWTAVTQLGFTGGRVLEPGCGSGTFIGLAPPSAEMVGVEKDPTTAAIASALYPEAEIRTESFADSPFTDDSFDLTIGNVPFGRLAMHDPRHNRGGHSIHNHFLIKSLHLTRPGGLVIAVTSRYTLDARNPVARRELADLADLVGAIRLPSDAHQRAAGTSVITDILVLRRREPGRSGNGELWAQVAELEIARAPRTTAEAAASSALAETPTIEVNRWFHDHPDLVLGSMRLGRGAHREDELMVLSARPIEATLPAALDLVVERAAAENLRMAPPASGRHAEPKVTPERTLIGREGLIEAADDGTFTRVAGGVRRLYQVPGSQAMELRALLGIRDTTVALLDAESATGADTAEIAQLRSRLGQRYTAYIERWGPIKRCTWRRTGRHDPDTGEERMSRVRPAQGGFRHDPFAPLVRALERYDDVTGAAARASIFTERVVAPRAPRSGADSPADALALCLDTHGAALLPEIARLLGTTPDEARASLGDLVFDEPVSGGESDRLVPAAEYLSGNVRTKLAAAQQAVAEDPRFAANVTALTAVLPADLLPAEISVRLGAPWVDAAFVQQFLRETLEDPRLVVEHPGGAIWAVRGLNFGVAATSTWGTKRRSAPELAEALLAQRTITVYDELEDGTRALNMTATVAAQEKARELDAHFAEWVWAEPRRAATLARTYNDTFNSIVLRNYDDVSLSLPGVSVTFIPRPHQVAAVARMIGEPAVGLFHEVGAGKTAEMVMGVMELRRLGLVRKPTIVVPNHMLEQFATEFLAIYPRANLLPAGRDDLAGDRRREFVGRVATGDWDAIILTRSAFERLPVRLETQRDYLERETERLQDWIANTREAARAGGGRSMTIKRMELMLENAQERIKRQLAAPKDPGITFESTGIDYLVIDEAHDYKNLRTPSNIPDVAVVGSQRATDLDMKINLLRQRHGDRVVTLATATPIANSVAEAYTMQRYLRPDLLNAAGLTDFDCWAATFGEIVTGIELSPDGASFRMKSRFARFRNVPELLRLWHVSADVKTAEDLKLPVPLLAMRPDGQRTPETVVIPPSPELRELVVELGQRADRVRGSRPGKGADNMLKISSDGRQAALDLRLVDESTDAITKLDVAADRIAAIWRRHRDDAFPDRSGQPHARPGALQLVFCDLGTPKPEDWNVYHELRDLLHLRGLPNGSVRFIHEARNDIEKGVLFNQAVEGGIAVLLGSTQRMGVGTNVQLRAIALHHLDCPWRPADLAQRDGRILRQGNHNAEVRILRYVTEGSFDAYSWQTVTRKASFISQIMRGRLDLREIEDVGDVVLSYDEVKALATGDPRVLDKARLDAEVARLDRLERAHYRDQVELRHAAERAEQLGEELTAERRAISEVLPYRVSSAGDAFTATIGSQTHRNRADAGRALLAALSAASASSDGDSDTVPIGSLAGVRVSMRREHGMANRRTEGWTIHLAGLPRLGVYVHVDAISDTDPTGLATRLENRITGLDRRVDQLDRDIVDAHQEAQRARATHDRPFIHADRLSIARAEAAELHRQMHDLAAPRPEELAQKPAGPAARPTTATRQPQNAANTLTR